MEEGKLSLESKDIAEEKRQELLRLFPEAQTEGGKIDFDQLKRALGESVDAGRERYGMNWPGKADCFRLIQSPSTATLLPVRGESVRFDDTENMIIEGDNLEVLKLLQKGYQNKVKMIYIDPPYNTGNDFIYPDDFADNLKNYLQYTGQLDRADKKFSNNLETDGRFHSNWLNMMYPRLYLARNLLREDGVIFISIDDKEAANVRALCDQIFGSENYLVTMYVQVRFADKTLAEKNDYQKLIEQVLVYQRSNFKPNKDSDDYTLENFCWKITELAGGTDMTLGGKEVTIFTAGQYEIKEIEPSLEGLKETWATGSVLKGNASGKFFGDYLAPRKQVDGLGCLYKVKGVGEDGIGYRYFTGPKREDATKGKFFSGVPLTRRAELQAGASKKYKPVQNLSDLSGSFGNCRHEGGVDFPSGKKPVAFIDQLLSLATSDSEPDIVLDFFAGSGSTGHSVLDKNRADLGIRRFILVQIPEQIEGQPSQHISDLTIRRLRNVCATESQGELEFGKKTEGFRVFKLAQSNFKVWEAHTDEGVQGVERQMELAVNHILPNRTAEDLFYEILMKSEYPLTAKVETFDAAGIAAFSVENDALIVCVERKVTAEAVAAIAKRKPAKVIFLDEAFSGNDQLKANAKMNFESAGVKRFETV